MASRGARTVAIVGAGPERRKFGNKSVRAHAAAGFTVYPVHPTADIVEGLTAYRSVKDVPVEKLDRVTVYLPPAVGLTVLADVATKSPGEVWFNPGAESPEVLADLESADIDALDLVLLLDLEESDGLQDQADDKRHIAAPATAGASFAVRDAASSICPRV
jgi:hypothetical protein